VGLRLRLLRRLLRRPLRYCLLRYCLHFQKLALKLFQLETWAARKQMEMLKLQE
jgi:hypothetical protein